MPHRMQHDAAWARRAQRELRDLLNDWDPIDGFDPEGGEGPSTSTTAFVTR